MLIRLPNGLLDGQDLFNYAEIDELRGKQQNYLANRDLVVGNIGHIPKILNDMLLQLQTKEGLVWKGDKEEALKKLPLGDLETILIKIRENTYGPKFFHTAECEHCGHVHKNLKTDLDTLELDLMSVEELLQKHETVLPKSERKVELKPPYLDDLHKIVQITKDRHDALVTCLAAISVKRIDDDCNITPEKLEDLPALDIEHLQETVEESKLQGTIDTTLEVTCSNCGKDFENKLNPFDASFFVRTRGSNSSRM